MSEELPDPQRVGHAEIEERGSAREYKGRHHVVRPRWGWAGLVLMILGAVVAAVGLIGLWWWWVAGGGAVMVVGAGCALFGGLIWDIEGRGISVDEDRRRVPGATARADEPEIERHVAAEENELSAMRARHGLRPTLQRPAALLMLGVAAFLIATVGSFFEQTPVGRDGTLRVEAIAIVLGLAGLTLLLTGPSVVAGGLSLLAGLGLVLSGLLADNGGAVASGVQVVCGLLVLLAGVGASQGMVGSLRSRGR